MTVAIGPNGSVARPQVGRLEQDLTECPLGVILGPQHVAYYRDWSAYGPVEQSE